MESKEIKHLSWRGAKRRGNPLQRSVQNRKTMAHGNLKGIVTSDFALPAMPSVLFVFQNISRLATQGFADGVQSGETDGA